MVAAFEKVWQENYMYDKKSEEELIRKAANKLVTAMIRYPLNRFCHTRRNVTNIQASLQFQLGVIHWFGGNRFPHIAKWQDNI